MDKCGIQTLNEMFIKGDTMQSLDAFSEWLHANSSLADTSIYKYTRAVNTISNEMMERGVVKKSLLEMNLVEIDVAIECILCDEDFIAKNSTGKRMYSNALKQFRYFSLESLEKENCDAEIVQAIEESKSLSYTEKQAIIKARVGQGRYREKLLDKYEKKCVVTGIDKVNLLIASHIKPWAVCNNEERIDIENGLILCPNLDRLFDSGLITFKDDGGMVISSFVGKANENRLHISKDTRIDLKATGRMLGYLEYHRDVLFVK